MDIGTTAYLLLWAIVLIEGTAIIVLARTFGSMILGTRDAIERDGLPIGASAPAFDATERDGSRRQFELGGAWQVLIFASPACRICRSMLPALGALSERLAEQVRFVILLRADADELREFPAPGAVETVAIGHHGTAERYRVRVSPYVMIVDPSGVIRAKGLANEAPHIEHFLKDAGFVHPIVLRHEKRAAEIDAVAN